MNKEENISDCLEYIRLTYQNYVKDGCKPSEALERATADAAYVYKQKSILDSQLVQLSLLSIVGGIIYGIGYWLWSIANALTHRG